MYRRHLKETHLQNLVTLCQVGSDDGLAFGHRAIFGHELAVFSKGVDLRKRQSVGVQVARRVRAAKARDFRYYEA